METYTNSWISNQPKLACSQKQNVQNTNSNEFQYPSLDHGVTTISDYEYIPNFSSGNWISGNTSPEQIKAQVMQSGKNYR